MKTYLILLALTLFTGWLSGMDLSSRWIGVAIMAIGVIKLLLVAFQFMELKHAHILWKSALVLFCLVFLTTLSIVIH